MPNHCINQMVVSGDEESLKAFVERAKGEEEALDLNSFVPMPVEIRNMASPDLDEESVKKLAAKHGRYARQNWIMENWGTKWGCYYVNVGEIEDGSVEFRFCTAWCTFRDTVLIAMSASYPTLYFEHDFAETENGLWGRRTAERGRLLLDDFGDFKQFDKIPHSVRLLADLEQPTEFSSYPDDLSLSMYYEMFIEDTSLASWDDAETWETEFVQWLMVHISTGLLPYQEEGMPVIRRAYQEALSLLGHS